MSHLSTIANRYRLLDELGHGGMGVVYHAYDRLQGTHVALKRIVVPSEQDQERQSSQSSTSQHLVLSLANEFRTLASLRHPHIVSVLDYGFEQEESPFFTMMLIENALNIKQATNEAPLDTIAQLLFQILQALHYLHHRRILHRDLKPGNILVRDNHAYLLDFGLAADAGYAGGKSAAGTLHYLAPEILRGQPSSVASDLYALGVIAYELYFGAHPFNIMDQDALIGQVLFEPAQAKFSLRNERLTAFLLRLLEKDPSRRYQSVLAAMQALSEATNFAVPLETAETRESFLRAARFVGRDRELNELKAALSEALEQTGSAWLIGGESGVGKSRLVEELRILALVRGALVVRGRAVSERGLPYQLWRDVLPMLSLQLELSDEEVAILRDIVPSIEQLLDRSLQSEDIPDERVRLNRLPFVIADVIGRVAQQKPLILILEDLQWAAESLEILKTIVPMTPHQSVLIIATYRSDESPHLHETLPEMDHLVLSRLSPQSVQKLCVSMLGEAGKQDEVIALLNRETGGNTFFIVEVIRELAEDAGQLANIGRTTLPGQIFAEGVQRIVGQRLSRLPAWARPVAELAAVAGKQIDIRLLKQVEPDLAIEGWLAVCADLALVSVDEDRWYFAHDKVREQLIAQLDADKEQQLHARIGHGIESLYPDQLDSFAIILMKHFAAAGNEEKEGFYAALCAERILDYSPQDALNYAQRALALHAGKHAENPQIEVARLQHIVGRAYVHLSQFEEARQYLNMSREAYKTADDRFGAARANNVLGEVGMLTDDYTDALPRVQSSLETFRDVDDVREIYAALTNLAIINAHQGNLDAAAQYFQEGLQTILRIDAPIEIAKAYNNNAIIADMMGNDEKAHAMVDQSLQIRRRIKDHAGIASSLLNLGNMALKRGDHARAQEQIQEAVQKFRLMGKRRQLVSGLNALGRLNTELGQYDIAIRHANEAAMLADAIGTPRLRAHAFREMCYAYRKQNQLVESKSMAIKVLELGTELDLMPIINDGLFLWAQLTFLHEDYEQALHLLALVGDDNLPDDMLPSWQQMIDVIGRYFPAEHIQQKLDDGHLTDKRAEAEKLVIQYEGRADE